MKKSKAMAAPEKLMMKKSMTAPMISPAMMSMMNDMEISRPPMNMINVAPADFEMQ